MSLNADLDLLREDVLASIPEEARIQLLNENMKLFSSFIEEKALKENDSVPDVFFRDKNLQPVYLKEVLSGNHLVISFYRGTWCPYCDMELNALAKINSEIEAKGARLIAVSPELYEFAEETIEKNNIDFPVLTDLANKAAGEFGLVFDLPPEFRKIYKMLNIHLNKLNKDDQWALPIPATFIVSKEGVITSAYVNADYMQRMEPDDILDQLDLLNA